MSDEFISYSYPKCTYQKRLDTNGYHLPIYICFVLSIDKFIVIKIKALYFFVG